MSEPPSNVGPDGDPRPGLRGFFGEVRRRRVWRVAAVYAATAFVAVEAADLFLPRLALPDWTITLVVRLAVLGFPVALLLAWVFDFGSGGLRRTEALPGAAGLEPARRLAVVLGGSVLAVVAGAGWWSLSGGVSDGPVIGRVAVLPLANLMSDPSQDYFVQGMHDRLISELQQAGVEVIARTSVMKYASGATPIRSIARELGVDAVIEGSVFRAADSVTIEARLVDGLTERYLWREAYGGDLRNVASLYGDLTRAIAGEIRRALGPLPAAPADAEPPIEPRAYEAYLRGVFHLHRFTAEDNATARHHFERAIEIDSTYAPAWVGLGKVWQYGDAPPAEARPHWERALERALELDPALAEAHFMRAAALAWSDWDWHAAADVFERAIGLNPGYAEGRMFYSHLLLILGRSDEAELHADIGLKLDPLNPFIRGMHAAQLTVVGQLDEAIHSLRATLDANPGAQFGRGPLATTLGLVGRHEEAIDVWQDMLRDRGMDDVATAFDLGYGESGARGAYLRAADALAALGTAHTIPPVAIAGLYVQAGESERALDMLERGLEVRDSNMPYIGIVPALRPLHDHPRFRALAGRVNVPILPQPGTTLQVKPHA